MTSATKLVQWLGSGDPPAQLLAHLKSRGLSLRLGTHTQTLPPARLSTLGAAVTNTKAEKASLAGRRVAVLNPDPGAADVLAVSLRKAGATVLVLSLDPALLDRVENFDPDAVLVEPSDFVGGCWEVVRALWTHQRLRWAPIVLTPIEPSGFDSMSPPDADAVCQAIQELSAPYDTLLKRAASRAPFEVSLATLGPARTLRALVASGARLRVCLESCAHVIELDIAEHVIVGAQELDAEEPEHALLGPEAIAHVLSVDQAKVSVKSVASPATTNILAPLEDALHAARAASTRPLTLSSAPVYVARKSLPIPNNDGIATVRPPPPPMLDLGKAADVRAQEPNAARVYPFPTPVALPAAPAQPPAVQVSRVFPAPRNLDRDRHVASAAALNIDVDLGPSVVAPNPDALAQELEAPALSAAPKELSESWESAELNRLVAEHSAVQLDVGAATESTFRQKARARLEPAREWLSKARKSAEPAREWMVRAYGSARPAREWMVKTARPAREWMVKTYQSARPAREWTHQAARPAREWVSRVRKQAAKPSPQTMLIAVLFAVIIALMVRSPEGAPTSKAPARSAGRALKIRVQKLPSEVPVAKVEAPPSEEQVPAAEVEAAKSDSRRASQLVSEGHAFRREGKLAQAEKSYREALRAYPGYPRAFAGLSQLAIQQGDGTTAVRYARALVKARPLQGASHLLLGDAYRVQGDIPAAKKAWTAAAKRGDRAAKNRLK